LEITKFTAMQLHFYKYHGTGNDFVILDTWKSDPQLTYQQIQVICDRHFGIGADGLMMIRPVNHADFEMLYFNADGKPGSMCGNGSRCLVHFAFSKGYCENQTTFLAPDGMHDAEFLPNGWVSVSMRDVNKIDVLPKGDIQLDTGSPHFIRWQNPEETNVVEEGKSIRYNDVYFEKGINVNFAEVENDIVSLRTYERGVEDETLSCGTGITATVIAAAFTNKIDRNKGYSDVQTKGGHLRVRFKYEEGVFTHLRLEGPAVKVFEGIIQL
jgi:diaminopimelate epimerase